MSFRVYVAAPYGDGHRVRRTHALLRYLRLEPTSSWAETADGPEDLGAIPVEKIRALAAKNDEELLNSDAVLVLARVGAGHEMCAEARLAIDRGIAVVWVGEPRCLSACRNGVDRVDDMTEAFARLCQLAAERDSGPATVRQILAPIRQAAS